jgi:L-ascorbate metabolism protein UlaG (beta-lactamase superfamily)
MIQPLLAGDALLADVAAARQLPGQLHVWWLGQSGFLVQWQGRHLLFDPYLSDSLTRKYAATDKPHVRLTAQVIAPEQLNFVDVVTASHSHTDHLDPETLRPLVAANPALVLVGPEAIRETARERSGLADARFVGMTAGQVATVGPGFEVHAVPAAHETLATDELGRNLYLGFVVKVGPWTLYHAGDTVLYPGLAELLRPFRVDLALLPINGRAPERRVSGNLSGREAAQLAAALGVRCVVPCHYEMFSFNTASPAEFVETCQHLGQPCAVLRAGERWSATR